MTRNLVAGITTNRRKGVHDIAVFRNGLARGERPGEPEAAACADWRVTGCNRTGYGAGALVDDLCLRCGDGVDAWSCLGEPCLRRKYRGEPGPFSGRVAQFGRLGEGGKVACTLLLLVLSLSSSSSRWSSSRRGCGGLVATSVGRGEPRVGSAMPAPVEPESES